MKLFGINLAPIYFSIAMVESDLGATSTNVYQISEQYVRDVNRIMAKPGRRYFPPFSLHDVYRREKAEDMMRVYWYHWGEQYERKTYKPVTPDVLIRIHNGGPFGWKEPDTVGYYAKVRALLLTVSEADGEKWLANRRPDFWRKCVDNYRLTCQPGGLRGRSSFPHDEDFVSEYKQ